jgi:hypothetical protein
MSVTTRDFGTPGDGMMARAHRADDTLTARTPVAFAPRVSERMVLISVATLVTLVAVLTVTPWPVGAFQDDAMYTVLARSIAEGHGYRFLNLPGEPHATHFPPGYPLVLALLWKFGPPFPHNIVLFKFANAVFLGLAAVGCHRFVRVRLGATPAQASVAAIAGPLSIVVLVVTGVVLSEPLFMALLFPSLLAAERAAESGSPREAAVAGAWLGALALVRTIGAVAIPATALVLLLRRRWSALAALTGAAAVLVLPWQLWVSAYQHEVPAVLAGKFGSYGPWLLAGYQQGGFDFARAVAMANLQELQLTLGHLILPVPQPVPRHLTLAIVCLLAAFGMRAFARMAPVTLAFLVAYAVVVVLWPFPPSRFLFAVWPLAIPVVAAGVRDVWQAAGRSGSRRPVRVAVAMACVACAAGYVWYNANGYRHQWWASIPRQAGERARPIAEWAAAHTPADAVLSSDDDLIVYLYAGRRAVPTATFLPHERVRALTDAEDLAHARAILHHYQPDYYVVNSQQGTRTAETLARETPPMLRYTGNLASVRIYSRLQP